MWHTHRELEEDEGTSWMLDERFGSRRSSCATTGRTYNIKWGNGSSYSLVNEHRNNGYQILAIFY